jgi:hypothetical protein
MNFTERGHQVGFMREIYSRSEQVLICLSLGQGTACGREFQWLSNLYEIPPLPDNFANDHPRSNDNSADRFHWHRLKKHLWHHVLDTKFVSGWLSVYDILESPWWSRAWVFQEFIASSQVYFLYYREHIAWKRLSSILLSYCWVDAKCLTLDNDPYGSVVDQSWTDGPELRQLCRVIARKTDINDAIKAVEFTLKSKIKWSGYGDLKELLAHSRYCKLLTRGTKSTHFST